jgi:hypothetical protein
MKLNRNAVLITLAVLLLVGLIIFVIYGCFSSNVENFEDKEDKKEEKKESSGGAASDLTPKEQELFQDLKDNKLSTEQITELVKGGILTEALVEKFLNQLDASIEDVSEKATAPVKDKKEDFADEEETKEDFIEGFSSVSPSYACATF